MIKANWNEIKGIELLGHGVMHDGIRKVFSGNNCMVVLNEIKPLPEQLKEIPVHSHPHEQMCYILDGKCKFKLGDEVFDMNKDDIILCPPNIPHGLIVIGDKTVLNIDIFSPIREDFLDK